MNTTTLVNDLESPFYLEELFFSRTNLKGHIQSGNKVFQRVSEFSWEELIGKPHNVVRHQDMPRGLYKLFWKHLESSTPIGAYVKNRSKSGKFYWVFALALPIENGYLSIRLKPSATILESIIKEYALLCSHEETISPEESQKMVIRIIQGMGFSTYQEFMCHSLIEELNSRNIILKGQELAEIGLLKRLNILTREIAKIPETILSSYKAIILTPLNLEITALNLGEKGRSVGVVASTYQKMISEIEREIIEFEKTSALVDTEIKESTFLNASHYLITEIINFFQTEDTSDINLEDELYFLLKLKETYKNKADLILKNTKSTLTFFQSLSKKLNSQIVGLEVIRLTGRMEIGRLESDRGLSNLLDDLKVFQVKVNDALKMLESQSSQIVIILDKVIAMKDS